MNLASFIIFWSIVITSDTDDIKNSCDLRSNAINPPDISNIRVENNIPDIGTSISQASIENLNSNESKNIKGIVKIKTINPIFDYNLEEVSEEDEEYDEDDENKKNSEDDNDNKNIEDVKNDEDDQDDQKDQEDQDGYICECYSK